MCIRESFGVFEISLKHALQIIEDNKKGKRPKSLEDFVVDKDSDDFKNAVGQGNINRFDSKKTIKKRKNKSKRKNKF